MPHTFTRQELYDLVWSEPMRDLAKKYSISDRGLAKACAKANIPIPERGYWNKLQVGKKVVRASLPPRGLGSSDQIIIGGRRYGWEYNTPSVQEIMDNPLPSAPTFGEDISLVREKVSKLVGKVPITHDLSKPHLLIKALLDKDEERRQKQAKERYPSSWDNPVFDSIFEKRRLRILNSIFMALSKYGMRPHLGGNEARRLSVTVGDTHVSFLLESTKVEQQVKREEAGYAFQARSEKDPMFIQLPSWSSDEGIKKYWQDNKEDKLEKYLREIVIDLIVAGEQLYRLTQLGRYKWLVNRKSELEERERQRILEEDRQRLEKRRQYEQACVDHLLNQANAYRQANEIRAFVRELKNTNSSREKPLSMEEINEWLMWALEQADRIDPIKSETLQMKPKNV